MSDHVSSFSQGEIAASEGDSSGYRHVVHSESRLPDTPQDCRSSPRGCSQSTDKSIRPDVGGSQISNEQKKKKKKKKTKNPPFLSFLTTREPSAKALAEYQDAVKKQQHSKGDSRPSTAGMAMVSTAKLPADVPKVNSKWSGLPNPKKSTKPSSTDSLMSSASSLSSSKASRASKGLQGSEVSVTSFSTYGRSISSANITQSSRDNRMSRTWVSPPSPTAPSIYSLPTLSSGIRSAVSTPKESPFHSPDEMFPHVPSNAEKLPDLDAPRSTTRHPKILRAKSFQSLNTPNSESSSSLLGLQASKPFNNADSDAALPKPTPPYQTVHAYHEVAKDGQTSSLPSESIVQRPATSHSSVSESSTGTKQITGQRGTLQHCSTTEERPKLPVSPISTDGDMHPKRTTYQQRSLEKVAPWEEPGFQLPSPPPPPLRDIDTRGKESRVKKFFRP